MDMQQWLETCLKQFPEILEGTNCNHNPVIGLSQLDTLNNVVDILILLQDFVLFPHGQDNSKDFGENHTTGLSCILSCAIEALQFELEHRR